MAAKRVQPVQISQEQMRRAFEQQRRPTWPTTFDAAINDPFFERLVRLEARRLAMRALAANRTRTTTANHPMPRTAPTLDHKRRAAGERDDD